MSIQTMGEDQKVQQEQHVLELYACRWAVLAAWHDEVTKRGMILADDVGRSISLARTKIASGCFSVCEVGCDLNAIEGALMAGDTSHPNNAAESWLHLLAQVMTDPVDTRRILQVPAVMFQYQRSGIRCKCA